MKAEILKLRATGLGYKLIAKQMGCSVSNVRHHCNSTVVTSNTQRKKTYICWRDMIKRCHNDKCKSYPNYGARGIIVCDEWRNNFQAFIDDMGLVPDGMQIDRINNDGNYELANCKWSTRIEQANNRRKRTTGYENVGRPKKNSASKSITTSPDED